MTKCVLDFVFHKNEPTAILSQEFLWQGANPQGKIKVGFKFALSKKRSNGFKSLEI